MATILVTGGTGALGRDVVTQLLTTAHEVRVLSRRPRPNSATLQPPATPSPAASPPMPAFQAAQPLATPLPIGWAVGDLRTGAGLDEALRGVGVIVHCASNPRRPSGDLAAARHLIEAAKRSGRPYLVYVSIVGVDQVPLGYYGVKLEVERLVERSGLPWTVLRATQFHDLLCYVFQWAAKLPVLMIPAGVSFQPVDTRDVAVRLATLATGDPAGRADDFGGPLVQPAGELARAWLAATERRRPVAPVRLPGRIMRGYAAGGHLTPSHADGEISFDRFLREFVTPASRPYGKLR
ncbi:MAG: SDR family oxidoreductase [Streptosporangiaceae bacterium]